MACLRSMAGGERTAFLLNDFSIVPTRDRDASRTQPIDHEVLPGILRIFEALLAGLGLLAFGVFDRALLLFA